MNINLVVSNSHSIPHSDLEKLKSIGSFWGGWQSWKSCHTDNVICYEVEQSYKLVTQKFYELCNLYVPKEAIVNITNPTKNMKAFAGGFSHEVDNPEEIIALHLVAAVSDIVILLGFNWCDQPLTDEKTENYFILVGEVIKAHPNVEWVIIDHEEDLRKDLKSLENLSKDTITNVLALIET
jgi:hypothetical protein